MQQTPCFGRARSARAVANFDVVEPEAIEPLHQHVQVEAHRTKPFTVEGAVIAAVGIEGADAVRKEAKPSWGIGIPSVAVTPTASTTV